MFLLGAALSALCQQQASKTVAFWPEKGNAPVKGFAQEIERHRTPSFSGKRWPCRRRGSGKSSSWCSQWLLVSLQEEPSESDSLVVLDASFQLGSFPFWPVCVETPVAQVLPEYVLDWDLLLDYQ